MKHEGSIWSLKTLMSFMDSGCRCSGLPIFRDHIDCICNIWHGSEQLGLSGALGGRGVLVFTGGHDILIFSLMCSLTCLGDFRCALSKGLPFFYKSELWLHFLLCNIECSLGNCCVVAADVKCDFLVSLVGVFFSCSGVSFYFG